MGRYRLGQCLDTVNQLRYLVLQDLFRNVLEFETLAPRTDLRMAMASKLERLARDGWIAEGNIDYCTVFVHRGTERRHLMLTPKHPHDNSSQTFNPHRPSG